MVLLLVSPSRVRFVPRGEDDFVGVSCPVGTWYGGILSIATVLEGGLSTDIPFGISLETTSCDLIASASIDWLVSDRLLDSASREWIASPNEPSSLSPPSLE